MVEQFGPDRNELETCPATGLEAAGDAVEIGGPPSPPDRLDHLDRGNGVEFFPDVAIVLKANLDPLGQSRVCNPRLGPGFLFLRKRQPDDGSSALPRLNRKAAPAAADLQQPVARFEVQPVEQPAYL